MGALPVDSHALVLSPSGAVAWVIYRAGTYELRVYDKAGERVLDSSASIVPGSLQLSGSTLSWTDGGVTRSGQI
jgi:hypothetical protein